MFKKPEIQSVKAILQLKKLYLPNYQRPYKWGKKNVETLLDDIESAIHQKDRYGDFKYRIGTIILHNDEEGSKLNIVDGQQRIITLALIYRVLDTSFTPEILNAKISSKISEQNIQHNFSLIKNFFMDKSVDEKKRYIEAMANILEVVIVSTPHLGEAFQLFDSQNTRGKALAPHDLLKAFHLRNMRDYPNEMKHAVEKWERTDTKKIYLLFQDYLFPIKHWIEKDKGHRFTTADIDEFKGVSSELQYCFAVRTVKAMPIFQIDQPFVSGKNFFEYVEHYLNLLSHVKSVVAHMGLFLDGKGVGFSYAKQLFYCTVLYYYDRFGNFDERIIKRLYAWAFMLRLRMQKLGFDSVRNYAIGEKVGNKETIPMFYLIQKCMKETDVMKIDIQMLQQEEIRYSPKNDEKIQLLKQIEMIFGLR